MTGLRLELRRGLGRWMVIPVAIAGAIAFWASMPSGTPIWAIATSSLGQTGQVMGPLCAAVAAIAGSRCARRRTETMELLSARSPVASGLAELCALLLWAIAAFGLMLTATFGIVAFRADGYEPDVMRTAAGLGGLLMQVTLGYAAGRFFPFRLTPLVVASAIYVAVNFVNSSTTLSFQNLFLPENLNLSDQFNRINGAVAPSQLLWYLGIALAAGSGWALWRTRSTRAASVVAMSLVLAVLGFQAVNAQGGNANEAGVVVEFVCSGHNPQLCMNPALEGSRREVRAAITPVVDRLEGTPFAVRRAEQRPRGVGSKPTRGALAFGLDDSTNEAIRNTARELATNALAPYSACRLDDGSDRPGASASGLDLLAVLVDRAVVGQQHARPGTHDDMLTAAAKKFDRISDATFRLFLHRHQVAIRACSLNFRDLA